MNSNKILVPNTIIELTGESTELHIWQLVKETIIFKFLKVNLLSYDLSEANRINTKDSIIKSAIEALDLYKIGLKCSNLTINEYELCEKNNSLPLISEKNLINSLDGTIFREPIYFKNVSKLIKSWKNPIVIAKHAFGDHYKSIELDIPEGAKVSIKVETKNEEKIIYLNEFDFKGIAMININTNDSIIAFAHNCFKYSLIRKLSLYLSTKNSILKTYDERFKKVFEEIFKKHYESDFKKAKINFEHKLIDDMVAFSVRSDGGYVWACKNYDGNIESAYVNECFSSRQLYTSTLYSNNGCVIFETIIRDEETYNDGIKLGELKLSAIATIFAWRNCLKYIGLRNDNMFLVDFCNIMEKVTTNILEDGYVIEDMKSKSLYMYSKII